MRTLIEQYASTFLVAAKIIAQAVINSIKNLLIAAILALIFGVSIRNFLTEMQIKRVVTINTIYLVAYDEGEEQRLPDSYEHGFLFKIYITACGHMLPSVFVQTAEPLHFLTHYSSGHGLVVHVPPYHSLTGLLFACTMPF